MKRRMLVAAIVPFWAAVAFTDGPASSLRGLERAPASERARENPLAGDPDSPRAGRKLFERHCAECHGDDARGRRKVPSLVSDRVRDASPGQLFWILGNGSLAVGMPGWTRLPEPQRWQLVSFLQSLQAPAAPGASPGADGAPTH